MVVMKELTALLSTRIKYIGKVEVISIDNKAFALHYRITSIMFLVFSVLVTCNQFLGDPIACIKSGDTEQKIINNYCWIEGTFTLPRALMKTIEFEYAHPGVAPFKFDDKDEIIEHTYYQWVSVVLFGQCMAFYMTRALWKVRPIDGILMS